MRPFPAGLAFLSLLIVSTASGQTPAKPVTLTGTATITYTPPATVVGPVGPTGAKGDKGDKGDPGKDGQPGQPGPGVGGTGRGIDVTQAPYLVGTGRDDEDGLRRLHATFVGNQAHTLTLPAVGLSFPRPLLIYKDNTDLDGGGPGQTICFTSGRYSGFAIGQFDPKTPDGKFTYDYASRPDISRVLDGTVQGWGFKTFGRSYAMDTGAGLQYGTYDRDIKCWSYWANTPGLTLEYAISGAPAPGAVLFAVGDPQFRPAPFAAVVADANTIWHLFAMDGDPDAQPRISVIKGLDFTKPVNRVRESRNHLTGEVVVWVNGVNQTPTPKSPGDLDIKGKSLKRNDHDASFVIAPRNGPVPSDYTLLGLKVSAVAVPRDAGNDNDRYLTPSPGCVGGFNSTVRDPEGYRGLYLFGGPAATGEYSYGLVFDNVSFGISPSGTTIRNLEINSGVMLAGAMNTRIINVKATGKSAGLDAAHNFANWPLLTESCTFGGDVAAIKEYNCISTHNNANIVTGGIASVVATGCKQTFNDPFVSGFGVRQEWAFMFLSGGYAGQVFINSLTIDGEFQVLKKGGFLVENCVGQARTLTVDGGAMDGLAPDIYAFVLVNAPANSGAFAAHFKVENFGFAAPIWVDTDWYGVADMNILGPADLTKPRIVGPPIGPGASRIKLVTP